jgi:hypothetical protein
MFTALLSLVSRSYGGEVTLRWHANEESDIAGYRLHYGTASREYPLSIDAGNRTDFTISNLQEGLAYFIAATAYDALGNESDYSAEIVHVIQSADSDQDGISDLDETAIYGTEPGVSDTDGDGVDDGEELAFWQDSAGADPDNAGNTMVAYNDGMAVDCGALGLWYFDGRDWIQLGGADPDWLCANGDSLFGEYGSLGLWRYDGASWTRLGGADPDNSGNTMVAYKDGVAIDYGDLGLWYYGGTGFTQLGGADPEWLGVYEGILVGDYGSLGLFQYDGVSWTRIGDADLDNSGNTMAAFNGGMAVDQGESGLWHYDGNAWTRLDTEDPEWLCVYEDKLVADFGSLGLWEYDGAFWTPLGGADPDNSGNTMVAYQDGVAVDYGAHGLWYWDGLGWDQLDKEDPQWLCAYGGRLVGDFGSAGIRHYDWYKDSDGDGFTNLLDADSDDDGYLDGEEIDAGSDPADPASTPLAADWTDYRIFLTMASQDNDAVGVMFRYQDADNYYRFSWDHERNYRRLVKCEGGVFTLLAEDAVPYLRWATYEIEIVCDGAAISVLTDDQPVLSAVDPTFSGGAIALYSWANQGSLFDNVFVENLPTGAFLLQDDFDDGDFTGWTVVDEGTVQGPSDWSVENGTLRQSSNIYSGPTNRDSLPKLGTFVVYDN